MWQQAAIGFFLLGLTIRSAQTSDKNCENTVLTAGETQHSFEVYELGQLIPENYKCTWTINGDGRKGITVFLGMYQNPPPNQCVKVGGNQTICSDDEYPLVEIYADKTEVYYSGKEGLKDIKSFGVYYVLGNVFSCGPKVLTAQQSKQFFHVNTESGTIPDGYQCGWVVTGENRSIEIFIENGSREDQCIGVTNTEGQEVQTKTLCAKTAKTYYKSSTSPVLVHFPGKEYKSKLPDFTMSYKLAGTNRRAPIFLTIGLFPILIQLENYIWWN